jgi:hypothetical protein
MSFTQIVMAGLAPAIHVLLLFSLAVKKENTWMPGARPGMTVCMRV